MNGNPLSNAAGGYLNFLHDSLAREAQSLENDERQLRVRKTKLQMEAQKVAGSGMGMLFPPNGGAGGAPQMPQPGPAMQPGQSSAPATPPAGPTAPPQPVAQGGTPFTEPKPYMSFDDHVANKDANNGVQLPAAPAGAPAAAAQPTQGVQNRDIGGMIQAWKRNGVPDELVLEAMNLIEPTLNAVNKQELNAVRSQYELARETHRMEIAYMRDDQATLERERRAENDRFMQQYRTDNLKARAAALKERLSAENARTSLQLKQYERLAKNDGAKGSLDRLKALNMQLGRMMQEMPGLESAIVNGTDKVAGPAADRLEAIRQGVDALQDQIATETATFLDSAGEAGAAATDRPTSALKKDKDAGSSSSSDMGKSRPPRPTDPNYDYKWDGKQWLRAKKQ